MARPRKNPPPQSANDPLPNRLAGDHVHQEPSVPTHEYQCPGCGVLYVFGQPHDCSNDDERIRRINAEGMTNAEEAPIDEPPRTEDAPGYLAGLAPERIPELDALAESYQKAKLARQAHSQVEKDSQRSLMDAMVAMKKKVYTTPDGYICRVHEKCKVTVEHDSRIKQSVNGINNDPHSPSLDALDDESSADEEAA